MGNLCWCPGHLKMSVAPSSARESPTQRSAIPRACPLSLVWLRPPPAAHGSTLAQWGTEPVRFPALPLGEVSSLGFLWRSHHPLGRHQDGQMQAWREVSGASAVWVASAAQILSGPKASEGEGNRGRGAWTS